jgi:hypothetical protein
MDLSNPVVFSIVRGRARLWNNDAQARVENQGHHTTSLGLAGEVTLTYERLVDL